MTQTTSTLKEWLQKQDFALSLSSGYFGFYAHAGMAKALEENNLTPVRITGSSAGALVGGALACGIRSNDIRDNLFQLKKQDFWDPFPGMGLLRGKKFGKKIREFLIVDQFEETEIPFALTAFDGVFRKPKVFESGDIAKAIQASCTVPLLFQPVWIGGRPYWDGGICDRPGLMGMPMNIPTLYHHIISNSPWRNEASQAHVLPQRKDLVSLLINELPRVTPDRLANGRAAYDHAYRSTIKALESPIKSRNKLDHQVVV